MNLRLPLPVGPSATSSSPPVRSRFLQRVALGLWGAASVLVAACGGGDDTAAPTPTTPPPVVATLATVQLAATATQLASSADTAAEGLSLTATARDTTGAAMPGVTVTFTAPTAGLAATSVVTDSGGLARTVLTTGGNAANRTVQVGAASGNVAATALTITVNGTALTVTGADLIAADTAASYELRLTNAAGEGIPNTTIELSPGAATTLSAAAVVTDATGSATVSLTASGASTTLAASALGATASKAVSVARDQLEFLQPTADTAFDLGTGPVSFVVRVQRNGADVADGYPVAFSTTRGSLSATQVTTVGGQASVQLSGSDAGLATVTATGDVPPQATASRTVNFRNVNLFQFSAPAAGSAAEVGTPVALTVTWQRNGAPVANGTLVRFNTTRGSLSSPTALAFGGSATVFLTGSSVGDADITAVGDLADPPAASVRVSLRDTSNLSLGFTAPAADATVHELSEVVPVSVTVRRNGAAVADGTVVNFRVDEGVLTASSVTTVNGVATVGVQGARATTLGVTATADVFGRAVTDRRTLIFRVAPTPLQVIVPAYAFPAAGNPAWASIFNSIRAKDALRFVVIIKQADTLFTAVDPAYLAAAQRVQAEGGRVIGHIPTDGAKRTPTVAQVKAAIDAYLLAYGGTLGGFFLDNMTTTGTSLDYYRQIYTYIKGKDPALGVYGNAKKVPDNEAFLTAADVIVTAEGNAATYLQALATVDFPSWIYRYPQHGFALLAHDVGSCAAMQALVESARTPKSNTGVLYITNDTAGANGTLLPYDTLPSYWELLVSTLDAINRGRALPACGP